MVRFFVNKSEWCSGVYSGLWVCNVFITKVEFMKLFKSRGENFINTPELLGSVNPSDW